jgi:hypothetical protein
MYRHPNSPKQKPLPYLTGLAIWQHDLFLAALGVPSSDGAHAPLIEKLVSRYTREELLSTLSSCVANGWGGGAGLSSENKTALAERVLQGFKGYRARLTR